MLLLIKKGIARNCLNQPLFLPDKVLSFKCQAIIFAILNSINMEKHNFNIIIKASQQKVWETLWGDETYGGWTSAFAEGSKAETDWNKGSKVLFTDGKGSGMVSMIADIVPNEFMSFKHLGELKDGIEDTQSEKVQQWAGSMEDYRLSTVDGGTRVDVDIDIAEAFKDYFLKTFPVALNKLKELAER